MSDVTGTEIVETADVDSPEVKHSEVEGVALNSGADNGGADVDGVVGDDGQVGDNETDGGEVRSAAADGGEAISSESPSDAPTPSQLEEEGDIAADYIEELLDIADLDGDIDIDTRGGRAYISVSAGEGTTNLRILSKPETVNALQELTRIAVQTKTGGFSRLILDVGGSRDARASELALLVDKAIARLDEGAEAASLPAMSSYERKLVHDIVSERGYVSASEGEGRDRHTVITRAK
jgi:spoIIIJ-associated protein